MNIFIVFPYRQIERALSLVSSTISVVEQNLVGKLAQGETLLKDPYVLLSMKHQMDSLLRATFNLVNLDDSILGFKRMDHK